MNDKEHSNDKLYQSLVETVHGIPWSYDLKTERFTFVGSQVEDIFGYPVEAWSEENFWPEHIHEEDREWALGYCMSETKLQHNHEFEYRMLTKDGRVIWIHDTVNVVVGESGPSELQGFMFDITERKQVELAINTLAEIDASQDMEGFFQLCVKSLASVYQSRYAFIGLISDKQSSRVTTQAVWAGSDYANNFEYDLKGTPCADILDNSIEIINSGAAEKYPEDLLLSEMSVDSYFGAPLIDYDGKTIGLVSVMDVDPMHLSQWIKPILGMFSKRISAEYSRHKTMEELEQRVKDRTAHLVEAKEEAIMANKSKSDFLSRMSHELRTPLNAIIGFSQLLESEDLEEEQKDHVNEVLQASNHLYELIEEVLDLARIESGEVSINIESMALDDIAMECYSLIKPLADIRNVTLLHPDISTTRPILADKIRLKEIIINLLSNAVKYNKAEGQVSIKIFTQDDMYVRVMVTDTGMGIPNNKVPLLFEPFSRLGAEYSDIEGTGIGLSICKQLINMMGGAIGVNSEPGTGSSFWIDCPIGEEFDFDEQSGRFRLSEFILPNSTVLYIEDNAANLRLIKNVVKREPNVTFLSATTAKDGIRMAKQYKPEIILMDINLPDINGYEALNILKNTPETSDIKVLALTAEAMPKDVERGLLAGFNRYITKPVNVSDLREALLSELQ